MEIGSLIINDPENAWVSYNWDRRKGWPGIKKTKHLDNFLVEVDHTNAICEFMLGGIRDLIDFKSKYSELPWK